MKKICLLLALLMCTNVLFSCSKTDVSENDTTSEISQDTEREIVRVALSEFTLVRPEKANKDVVSVAQKFRSALNEAMGGTIEFKSDFSEGELKYYGREIIFGETTRPESERAYDDLGLKKI